MSENVNAKIQNQQLAMALLFPLDVATYGGQGGYDTCRSAYSRTIAAAITRDPDGGSPFVFGDVTLHPLRAGAAAGAKMSFPETTERNSC